MRSIRVLLAAAFVVVATGAAIAQSSPQPAALSQIEIAVACAPPPTFEVPAGDVLRIIGTQDAIPRSEYGTRDLLVVNGGTEAGVQLGQQFFVRRANRFGLDESTRRRGARTGGWINIVAVNASTAIAAFEHLCGDVAQGDYLEPFVAPVVPAGADLDEAPGEPDFSLMGKVVAGNENRSDMGAGDFMLIDRGSEQGMLPGTRLALYRDVGVAGMPLAGLGEAIVISTSQAMSLSRITRSRDAVHAGDFVVTRR
jgi:hypothetical protein